MTSSASVRQCRARRTWLTCACMSACTLLGATARAQSSSLEPELWTLPTLPAPTRDRPSPESNTHGDPHAAEHLQVGALVGVSFPRPLSVEGIVKFERTLAFGLEYSTLPQVTVSNVQLGCWAAAGSARVFPFRGPFFVGLRAGRQHLMADAAVAAYGYSVPANITVDTTFLNPQIGFLWTWSPGISLGIDAGLQIPLSSQSSSTLQTSVPTLAQPFVTSAQQTAENLAKAVGQTTLPTLDLIRIGFLF